ncbi:hypothetical protein ACFL35_01875 [Candidatus Riflebacteria bacterium]
MEQANKNFSRFLEPFRSESGFDIPLIFIFILINGLTLINACLHDPKIGYDSVDHLAYIKTLAKLRLVTFADSWEFFSPPLPYAFPALLITITRMKVHWAAKFGQFLNVFLSLGLTYYLLKICQLISSEPSLKLGSLMFLGILPVYYKSFAFVRGEPYVAFFVIIIIYYSTVLFILERYNMTNAAILGITMGLCALSRQWGILLFPAVFLFGGFQCIRYHRWRHTILWTLCLCLVLISLIAGWFYTHLYFKYGSFTKFNRKAAVRFSLSNQPSEFYIGLSPGLLFNNPIRPNFPNQFFPIFYSELWGDYWGYFTLYGLDTSKQKHVNGINLVKIVSKGKRPSWLETNYDTIGAYLGRVNIVCIFPSVLALLAIVFACIRIIKESSLKLQREMNGLFLLAILTSIAGYFWFLIMYPNIGKGDTIKATYLLQIYPIVAILVGKLLESIQKRTHFLFRLILCGISLVFLHNIFAMVTHHSLYHLL